MKIQSENVIQADSPEREIQAIAAVAQGAKSDADIAEAIGNLDARQGRYYRRAGEVLGFLKRDAQNESALTPLGSRFCAANPAEKTAIMLQALLANPLIQRLVPFLESKRGEGATRHELELFLSDVAALGTQSMAHRRSSSYIHWLRHFGLVTLRQDKLVLQALPEAIPFVNFVADDEPLFPSRYALQEYEARARDFRERTGVVTALIDAAKRERAVTAHTQLVELVAQHLRAMAAIPKANRYVDLAAKVGAENFLFEMKSTTATNVQAQVRRGLSQLYEYRYLQQIENAKLVLVIEQPLPRTLRWIENYLRNDRNILLVWDGNNRLHCSDEVRPALPFVA